MKTISSLWRHRYLRTVGSLLIATVLIAAVVSCTPTPPAEYDLTMAVNPAGGGTATDLTGGSPYERDTDVSIQAAPASCYRFVGWTAPAGTFADATAATTTFTMPDEDVTVTANFEAITLGHFKFYDVDDEAIVSPIDKDVELVDQFGGINATVMEAIVFGNAAEKVHGSVTTPMGDPDHHLTLYRLEYEDTPQSWLVEVNNQFGDNQQLTVVGPFWLAVPTQKADHEAPRCLDHFLVYDVVPHIPEPIEVDLKDQWTEEPVTVYEAAFFANPVKKTVGSEVTEIQNPDDHLVFYKIAGASFEIDVQIDNQFGPQTLPLKNPALLAVPSEKLSWEQPLDHFKCYWVGPGLPWEEEVQLEDQFGTIAATVMEPFIFANPVSKWHGEEWTPISNGSNHLTFYWLWYEELPPTYWVQVTNQFGINQELWIRGPLWLAVPTQKMPHDPPEGLDHFLVYEVMDYLSPPDAYVDLKDQFTEQPATVYEPAFFANPVKKIHGDIVTPIQNPDDHLVFYWITGGDFILPELPVIDQFGPHFLSVYQSEYDMLGVPSLKIEWSAIS